MSEALEMAQEIAEALAEVGAPATLTHVTVGIGSDDSGDTTTTTSTFGVLDASSLQGLGYKFGSSLVQGGDCKLTVPGGLAFTPASGDTATVAGATWKVVANQPTYYGETIVSQDLLVRR